MECKSRWVYASCVLLILVFLFFGFRCATGSFALGLIITVYIFLLSIIFRTVDKDSSQYSLVIAGVFLIAISFLAVSAIYHVENVKSAGYFGEKEIDLLQKLFLYFGASIGASFISKGVTDQSAKPTCQKVKGNKEGGDHVN